MAVLYKFLDANDDLLYVGISDKDIMTRLKQHTHLSVECYDLVEFVEYCEFDTKCDVELIERYLVSKYKPKFNTVYSNKDITVTVPEFDNLKYTKMRYNFNKNETDINTTKFGPTIISSCNNYSGCNKELKLKIKPDMNLPILDSPFTIIFNDELYTFDIHRASEFEILIKGEWEINSFIHEMKKVIENFEKSIIDMR